ncbi:hypothetical protein FB45DRAFT_939184 [Roridomyces roridus]|uniref:DUF6534 domain-containing protein n=1 Tax=Roridomyces roridus TaxID=1738132 RepID=A0AAD7B8J9_9AGAR|nr:hypothetical protein FB45DRAFT_939184 [Roridomyces roridus]
MPAAVNVGPTLGAFQLGVLMSYLLTGISTTQTYIYFNRFPEDNWKLKGLVAFVWISEIGQSACIAHTLYVYTIENYGVPTRLAGALPLTFDVAVLLSSTISSLVQGLFTYRIYILCSRRIALPAIIWTVSLVRYIGCLGLFATSVRMTSVVVYEDQLAWLLTSVWVTGAANDVAIAASLVYLLYRQRNAIHHQTLPLLGKLTSWTIETGMMTSAWAVLTLIFFQTMEDNCISTPPNPRHPLTSLLVVWLAIYIIGVRVYSNSLFASLNGRSTLRNITRIDAASMLPGGLSIGHRNTTESPVEQLELEIALHPHKLNSPDLP